MKEEIKGLFNRLSATIIPAAAVLGFVAYRLCTLEETGHDAHNDPTAGLPSNDALALASNLLSSSLVNATILSSLAIQTVANQFSQTNVTPMFQSAIDDDGDYVITTDISNPQRLTFSAPNLQPHDALALLLSSSLDQFSRMLLGFFLLPTAEAAMIPVQLAEHKNQNNALKILFHEPTNTLYSIGGNYCVEAVNVADPIKPVFISRYGPKKNLDNYCMNAAIATIADKTAIFVADKNNGLQILSLDLQTQIGKLTGFVAGGIAVNATAQMAYLTPTSSATSRIIAVDLKNLASPTLFAVIPMPWTNPDISAVTNPAYEYGIWYVTNGGIFFLRAAYGRGTGFYYYHETTLCELTANSTGLSIKACGSHTRSLAEGGYYVGVPTDVFKTALGITAVVQARLVSYNNVDGPIDPPAGILTLHNDLSIHRKFENSAINSATLIEKTAYIASANGLQVRDCDQLIPTDPSVLLAELPFYLKQLLNWGNLFYGLNNQSTLSTYALCDNSNFPAGPFALPYVSGQLSVNTPVLKTGENNSGVITFFVNGIQFFPTQANVTAPAWFIYNATSRYFSASPDNSLVSQTASITFRINGSSYTVVFPIVAGLGVATTFAPTQLPTIIPTMKPTLNPTGALTRAPTENPTLRPTPEPTKIPTGAPTKIPTSEPTKKPTLEPSRKPTNEPTLKPTHEPTSEPTREPTRRPTSAPTKRPTPEPSRKPTHEPSKEPSPEPTGEPTSDPTGRPTSAPTKKPTRIPTGLPVSANTEMPAPPATVAITFPPRTNAPNTTNAPNASHAPTEETLSPSSLPALAFNITQTGIRIIENDSISSALTLFIQTDSNAGKFLPKIAKPGSAIIDVNSNVVRIFAKSTNDLNVVLAQLRFSPDGDNNVDSIPVQFALTQNGKTIFDDATLSVFQKNHAPTARTVNTTELNLSFSLYKQASLPLNLFEDSDGDKLSYTVTTPEGELLPAFIQKINGALYVVTCTQPVTDQIIFVTASDGDKTSAPIEMHLTCEYIPPKTINTMGNVIVKPGQPISIQLPTNIFSGSQLQYTATLTNGFPLPSTLRFDPTRLEFKGSIPTDQTEYTVQVTAQDIFGNKASSEFNITSFDYKPIVNQTIPPLTAIAKKEFVWRIPLSAFYDQDDEKLTYTIKLKSGAPLPNWCSFDAETRELICTPPSDLLGKTIELSVFANDGFGTAKTDVTLSIPEIPAPVANKPIVNMDAVTSAPFEFAIPKSAFNVSADAGELTYTAEGLPDWLKFENGKFYGTPKSDNADEHSEITLIATDELGRSAQQQFSINTVYSEWDRVKYNFDTYSPYVGGAFSAFLTAVQLYRERAHLMNLWNGKSVVDKKAFSETNEHGQLEDEFHHSSSMTVECFTRIDPKEYGNLYGVAAFFVPEKASHYLHGLLTLEKCDEPSWIKIKKENHTVSHTVSIVISDDIPNDAREIIILIKDLRGKILKEWVINPENFKGPILIIPANGEDTPPLLIQEASAENEDILTTHLSSNASHLSPAGIYIKSNNPEEKIPDWIFFSLEEGKVDFNQSKLTETENHPYCLRVTYVDDDGSEQDVVKEKMYDPVEIFGLSRESSDPSVVSSVSCSLFGGNNSTPGSTPQRPSPAEDPTLQGLYEKVSSSPLGVI